MRNPLPFVLGALALSACAATPAPNDPGPGGGRGGGALDSLLSSDANGDGVITRGEFTEARAARFSQLDRNRDGYLSRADAAGARQGRRGRMMRRGGGGGERLRQAMAAVDADGDGQVSRTEFVDGPGRLFAAGDADRNDRLDPREIEALRARLAARRGG